MKYGNYLKVVSNRKNFRFRSPLLSNISKKFPGLLAKLVLITKHCTLGRFTTYRASINKIDFHKNCPKYSKDFRPKGMADGFFEALQMNYESFKFYWWVRSIKVFKKDSLVEKCDLNNFLHNFFPSFAWKLCEEISKLHELLELSC